MSILKPIPRLNLVVVLVAFNFSTVFCQDKGTFGQNDRLSHAFRGEVYLLPENTYWLPDFDTLKSVGTIYSTAVDVPARNWQEGFPGVTDRFEWFAVVYKSSFTVKTPGVYQFSLMSDDGSKLFIDDSLVINNDGAHAPHIETGEIELDESNHTIEVQYFQGPRSGIALQLSAGLKGSKTEIFPTNDFTLDTPGFSRSWLWLLLPLIALLIYTASRKKKTDQSTRVAITGPADRSMFPCGAVITFSAQTVPPGREHEIRWDVPMDQQQDQTSGTGATFSVTWSATGVKQVVAMLDGSADDVILFLYKTKTGRLTLGDMLACEPPPIQRSAFDYRHHRSHGIPETSTNISA